MNTETPEAARLLPFEAWAAAKKLPAWQLAAARHHAAWPAGREVTEADFDKAVTEALNARIG